jgi:putative flippase GtrA
MDSQESFASRTKCEMWRVGSPFRFIVAGVLNALAGYSLYAVLLFFLPYLVAYSIAYVFGILLSYFLNSKLVFDRRLTWSKAAAYPLVYLVQYLLGTSCLYVLVNVFRVNKLVAPLLAVLLTIPATYLLNRKIITGQVRK